MFTYCYARYVATLKVKKTKSRHVWKKNYHLYWIADRSNIVKTVFFKKKIVTFGRGLYYFRSKFLSQVRTCAVCIPICFSSKRLSQILKIFFQTGHYDISVFRCVIFITHFQKKPAFPVKKTPHFSENFFNVAKYQTKIILLADLEALQSYSFWKVTPLLVIGVCR